MIRFIGYNVSGIYGKTGETCFQLLGKVFITAADRISGATMSEKELDGGAKNMPEVSGQNAPQQKEVGSLMNHHQKQVGL